MVQSIAGRGDAREEEPMKDATRIKVRDRASGQVSVVSLKQARERFIAQYRCTHLDNMEKALEAGEEVHSGFRVYELVSVSCICRDCSRKTNDGKLCDFCEGSGCGLRDPQCRGLNP